MLGLKSEKSHEHHTNQPSNTTVQKKKKRKPFNVVISNDKTFQIPIWFGCTIFITFINSNKHIVCVVLPTELSQLLYLSLSSKRQHKRTHICMIPFVEMSESWLCSFSSGSVCIYESVDIHGCVSMYAFQNGDHHFFLVSPIKLLVLRSYWLNNIASTFVVKQTKFWLFL